MRELKVGDAVMTYDPERRLYFLGEIGSEVEEDFGGRGRARRTRWTQQVERDILTPATRNALGSIATLFKVSDEAREELWAKSVPLGRAPSEVPPPPVTPITGTAPNVEESSVLDETLAKPDEFVEDRLIRLGWEDMQELIAGILRAMGYRAGLAEGGGPRCRYFRLA